MKKLEPCYTEMLNITAGVNADLKNGPCSEAGILAEVQDTIKYQALVSKTLEMNHPPAAALFVVMHNMVTASVGNQYPEGRGNLYTVKEVLEGVPCSFVRDLDEAQSVDATKPPVCTWQASGLLGVSPDRPLDKYPELVQSGSLLDYVSPDCY